MGRESDNTNRPEDILNSVKTRLIASITAATADNTYISTIPEELPPNPDEVMFEISPGQNLSFDYGLFVGAGLDSLNTTMQLTVTVHITQQKDETGRDDSYLRHATLGAFPIVRSILKALGDHDLQDGSSNEQLSQALHPLSATVPPRDDREAGYATVVFEAKFDWDMG
ncbi:MAG: hypothetical protein CL480_11390 [Acidobacteria bacterium]|nr:hypothetical protein [Acidobacteriota bacterium]|tara:strand:- start:244 stop:750 length:507 start_codon:yes stop_codon:yes gene_type:complete